jgi:CubicO group peptidase (beta-lactamase class C family)
VLATFPAAVFSQALPAAAPEAVGLSSERLARVDALFESYIEAEQLAGVVVAIARRGKLVHFGALGRMDMAKDQPMPEDAIFRMASMTKPVTSTAIMMLLEMGHFQLDDPISRYIPELAGMRPETMSIGDEDSREMSIRDLLIHTAGLPGNGQDPRHNQVWLNLDLTLQQQMEEVGRQPLAYPPGTDWRYSEATNILGYLIEVVSGLPVQVFFEQRILQPLGMVDTSFFVSDAESYRLPAVYGVNDDGNTEQLWSEPLERELRLPKAPRGTGGLFSTAHDYVRFSQMLLNGGELDGVRLLSPRTVELMAMDHLPSGVEIRDKSLAGYGWGLGFRVRTDVAESQLLGNVGEYGWAGAYGTYFLIDPEEELVAMFLPQLRNSGLLPIRRQFNNAVYQAIVD